MDDAAPLIGENMTFEEWAADRLMTGMEREFARDAWKAAIKEAQEACAQACSAIALGDSKTEAEEIAAYKCEAAIRAL